MLILIYCSSKLQRVVDYMIRLRLFQDIIKPYMTIYHLVLSIQCPNGIKNHHFFFHCLDPSSFPFSSLSFEFEYPHTGALIDLCRTLVNPLKQFSLMYCIAFRCYLPVIFIFNDIFMSVHVERNGPQQSASNQKGVFSISSYTQYFNVDTDVVLKLRLYLSLTQEKNMDIDIGTPLSQTQTQ